MCINYTKPTSYKRLTYVKLNKTLFSQYSPAN